MSIYYSKYSSVDRKTVEIAIRTGITEIFSGIVSDGTSTTQDLEVRVIAGKTPQIVILDLTDRSRLFAELDNHNNMATIHYLRDVPEKPVALTVP